MAEAFTVLKLSDTHEWRFDGRRWRLHFLPSDDPVPLRAASRFEAELLDAAKREIEAARTAGEQALEAPSPMPAGLAQRIAAALECGALWTEKAEAHPRMKQALADFNAWRAGGVQARLLTEQEVQNAFAGAWDGEDEPPLWIARMNAVQSKLLEVNGLTVPDDVGAPEQPRDFSLSRTIQVGGTFGVMASDGGPAQ